MSHPNAKLYTASFEVPAGYTSFDLIFSSDFTGTVGGVAYAGTTDAVQSFTGNGTLLGSIRVVVTTGSVRVASVS